MKAKKIKIYLPIFLAIAVVLGIFIGSNLDYENKTALLFGEDPKEAKIKKLLNFIQYDYVDKVNTDSILDGTLKDIVNKLDPHSIYIPASEHPQIDEKMNGEFVGIGIQYRIYHDTITVLKTVKNGPSEKAGIKAGDRILLADKDTLFGKSITNKGVFSVLKGKVNSTVKLTVYRKDSDQVLAFNITRSHVPIPSLDASYIVKKDIGYIKLNSFTANSFEEFKSALNKLKEKGMRKLILDLRDNPGGFIGVTSEIVDEFLLDNKLIVFTKNNKGKIKNIFASQKGAFEKGKLYVLVNENSASASEILAGAIQDNDRGTIIGRRTFGKGLVQQDMPLGDDGSSVRLTIARYFTPTGRSIQKPYRLNHKSEYYQDDLRSRFLRGELTNKDSIQIVDSLKYITPKGKIVYGGGGIIPDVFVPIDTHTYFEDFNIASLNNFVFNYLDSHRKELENMPLHYFMDYFDEDGIIYTSYVKKTYKNKHISKENEQSIKKYLKALFAREIYNESIFYKILYQDDKMIEKVLELEGEKTPNTTKN
ncbi:MAG TPA: S41 family peptidase [Flavobacteriia bacterium]|nr:S41 family peptidase [Flavobacteriia bacterium]